MITTSTAISSLCPTAKFTINADDYDQLQWHSVDITKPTLSQINAKITELEAAEPMRLLREERDRRIAKTDWRGNSDLTMSDAWKTYRQALRDLPSNVTDIDKVFWPDKPE